MALSNSWSFTVVRDDIIREAMLNIGALGEAEVPTAQEVTDCARKLNMMVKSWMGYQDFAPGLKMWERQRATLFLLSNRGRYVLGGTNSDNWAGGVTGGIAGATHNTTTLTSPAAINATVLNVASVSNINIGDTIGIQGPVDIFWTTVSGVGGSTVTIPSGVITSICGAGAFVYNYTITAQRPLAIVTCILRDSNQQDIPMSVMTLQDYEALPTKAQSTYVSDPTSYYYESQFVQVFNASVSNNQGGGIIYLDVGGAQDITKHLHVVYMRPVMDMNAPGDNPEYPQQWYRALCWGLSKEICGMFDATWTKDMEDSKQEAIAFAKEGDSETSTFYFQPYATDPFGV